MNVKKGLRKSVRRILLLLSICLILFGTFFGMPLSALLLVAALWIIYGVLELLVKGFLEKPENSS